MKKDKEIKKEGATKEFFRPTTTKIILAIIFLVITLIFVYLITTVRVYIPQGGKDPYLSNPLFWVAALPSLLMITLVTSTETYLINRVVTFVTILILQIAYIYILPCLIVWLGNKLRRKLKTKKSFYFTGSKQQH